MVSSPKQTQPLLPLGLLLVTEALAGWFWGTKCPQHGCGHRPTCPHSGEDWDAEHPHTHRLPELPHIEAGFPGGHSRPPHFRLFRPRQRMAQQHFCYVLLVTARQRISAVGEGYLSWEGATSSAQSRGTAGSRVCTFITAPALDGGHSSHPSGCNADKTWAREGERNSIPASSTSHHLRQSQE